MIMFTFGQKLKKLRQEKGVSQVTAAEGIGIGKSTLASYELEHREPNIENINKISNYYKVDPSELIKPDLVPNYRSLDLKKLFDKEDIDIEGRRLNDREKAMIYRVAKAIIFYN
jgi:transcriptional regulator with XRE-family HTH domain